MGIDVRISPLLKTKLDVLSTNFDVELSGFLTGEIKDGFIYLKDLILPRQDFSKTNVCISKKSQVEMRQKYGDKVKEIVGHWHSHHNMGCFFSNKDLQQQLNGSIYKEIFLYMVSSVGQHLIRVYQQEPIRCVFDDCGLIIFDESIEKMLSEVDKIINKTYDDDFFIGNKKQEMPNDEDVEILYDKECSACHKKKKDDGYKTCESCREKSRKRNRVKRKLKKIN